MFCPKCGRKLPDSVKFCPTCGNPVMQQTANNIKPAVQNIQNTQPAMRNVQPTIQNFQPTMQNVQPTVQNVQTTMQNFQPTMQNVQPTVQNVQSTVQNFQPAMQNFSEKKSSKKGLIILLIVIALAAVIGIITLIVLLNSDSGSSPDSGYYSGSTYLPPVATPEPLFQLYSGEYDGEYHTDDDRYSQIAFTVKTIDETDSYYKVEIHVFSLGEYIVDDTQTVNLHKYQTPSGDSITVIYTEVINGVVYRDMPYTIVFNNRGNFYSYSYNSMSGNAKYYRVD